MAENLNADRYALALVVRTAVWGQPEDLTQLRPQARGVPATTADEDAAFAAALAAFGYIEVKDDE